GVFVILAHLLHFIPPVNTLVTILDDAEAVNPHQVDTLAHCKLHRVPEDFRQCLEVPTTSFKPGIVIALNRLGSFSSVCPVVTERNVAPLLIPGLFDSEL